MLKKRLMQFIGLVLIIGTLDIPIQAQENLVVNDPIEQLIVQPKFTNISIFQTGFDISSTGKASVNVYLTAQNVDSVKVDTSLQQFRNGAWTTIKSWTNTEAGTNAGLSGTYYVAKGYSYRLVSSGAVYQKSTVIEKTSYTSDIKSF